LASATHTASATSQGVCVFLNATQQSACATPTCAWLSHAASTCACLSNHRATCLTLHLLSCPSIQTFSITAKETTQTAGATAFTASE
jgi:hypothetical protein